MLSRFQKQIAVINIFEKSININIVWYTIFIITLSIKINTYYFQEGVLIFGNIQHRNIFQSQNIAR